MDRLVEPLLGGVYAGHAGLLSAAATTPQLVALARHGSLLEAAAALPASDVAGLRRASRAASASLPGGAGRQRPVRGAHLTRRSAAWRAPATGSTSPSGRPATRSGSPADAVVLACPAAPAARLLADLAPAAAAELAAIECGVDRRRHARLPGRRPRRPRDAVGAPGSWCRRSRAGASRRRRTPSPSGTGSARRRRTACCCCAPRPAATARRRRCSAPTTTLVATSLAELAGRRGRHRAPVASHVQRWGGALPQYAVGHLDRVARIRADVARVAGAGRLRGGVRRRGHPGRDRLGPPRVAASLSSRMTAMAQGTRHQRHDPLHDVVGLPAARRRSATPTAAPRRPRSTDLLDKLAADDVVTRGVYDVSGFRADADVMVWWHAATPEQLQDAYNRFRRTALRPSPRPGLEPVRAAPAGGVQQGPRPGVHGRRGAARLRLRLPVRAVLRVVPAARRGAPRDAGRARPDGPRATPTSAPTPSRRSPSATTSGCSPSRPTSCTGSST